MTRYRLSYEATHHYVPRRTPYRQTSDTSHRELLPLAELARILHFDEVSLRHAVNSGDIQAVESFDGTVLASPSVVRRYVAAQRAYGRLRR